MSETYVYKIKNVRTGRFMTKYGGWSDKGTTWDSLGRLKGSLSSQGFWPKANQYQCYNSTTTFGDEVKIIHIKIVEEEGNTTLLNELVTQQRRYAALTDKYGEPFRDLVERIEKQGQNEQFQWVLVAKTKWDHKAGEHGGDFGELLETLKELKLKQNKDFKKASAWNVGGAVAFASKQTAMRVRLMMKGRVDSVDIKEYVETDLDSE